MKITKEIGDGNFEGHFVTRGEDVEMTDFLRKYGKMPRWFSYGMWAYVVCYGAVVGFLCLLAADSPHVLDGSESLGLLIGEIVMSSVLLSLPLTFFYGGWLSSHADKLAGKRLQRALDLGRIIKIHPILLRQWKREIKRRGHKLTSDEFERELTARFDLFGSLNGQAKALAHRLTDRRLKAKLAREIKAIMRDQGELLEITCAPRKIIEQHVRDAHNVGVAAQFDLTAD